MIQSQVAKLTLSIALLALSAGNDLLNFICRNTSLGVEQRFEFLFKFALVC